MVFSLSDLQAWLDGLQNAPVAEQLSRKVVVVWCKEPEDEAPHARYKVMTSAAGFVNSSYGIMQRPNAVLVFHADRPWGDYNLVLKTTAVIPATKEITIGYGPLHPLGAGKRRGGGGSPRRNKKRPRKP